jgi:hypothetical protein
VRHPTVESIKALLARQTTVVTRPVWIGCDGWLRVGRTEGMVTMLDDLGIRTSAQ